MSESQGKIAIASCRKAIGYIADKLIESEEVDPVRVLEILDLPFYAENEIPVGGPILDCGIDREAYAEKYGKELGYWLYDLLGK